MSQLILSDIPKYGVVCYADIIPAHPCSHGTADYEVVCWRGVLPLQHMDINVVTLRFLILHSNTLCGYRLKLWH